MFCARLLPIMTRTQVRDLRRKRETVMIENERPEQHENISIDNIRPFPGTPRWVKAFAIIALAAAVLFVIVLLSGGHGPARHMQSGRDSGNQTPLPSVTEHAGQ